MPKGDKTIKRAQQEAAESKKWRHYMFYILAALRRHSDKNNPLTQVEIAEKIFEEYGVKIDRKTIGDNLEELISLLDDSIGSSLGFSIEFARKEKEGEEGEVPERLPPVYLAKSTDISDDEMRYLIDTLMFSKHISYMQNRSLVDKLVGLSSKSFKDDVKHAKPLPADINENEEFLKTFGIITKAIKNDKQINFKFSVPVYDGVNTKECTKFSPYELVISNSKYYLIGAFEKGHSYIYIVDFMHDVEIPEKIKIKDDDGNEKEINNSNRRPMFNVEDLKEYVKDGIDLVKYLGEHIYMFSGVGESVNFTIDKDKIYHVYDWFGKKNPDVSPYVNDDSKLIVNVKVVREAMVIWAQQFGEYVEVLTPDVRKDVREAVEKMWEKYK